MVLGIFVSQYLQLQQQSSTLLWFWFCGSDSVVLRLWFWGCGSDSVMTRLDWSGIFCVSCFYMNTEKLEGNDHLKKYTLIVYIFWIFDNKGSGFWFVMKWFKKTKTVNVAAALGTVHCGQWSSYWLLRRAASGVSLTHSDWQLPLETPDLDDPLLPHVWPQFPSLL